MVNKWHKKRGYHRLPTPIMMAAALFLAVNPLGRVQASDNAPATAAARVEPSPPAPSAVGDMVRIPAGEFSMGYEQGYDDERPVHQIRLSAFEIDRHEVTNQEFAAFVDATGYVTRAERDGECWSYTRGTDAFQLLHGANWRHPQGPGSSIDEWMNHPVVCVNWYDASAYARWAGKRLPTEAEWEYAARAGSKEQFVANASTDAAPRALDHSSHDHLGAGKDLSPSSKSHLIHTAGATDNHFGAAEILVAANIWEGHWPDTNALVDGFFYTAHVESFEPNAWGVFDMLGNVWEWTGDWYDADYYKRSPETNPTGAEGGTKRVARGGSWFCSPNYCGAYSTHYRGASPPDRAFNNVGFRCARDSQ